MSLEEGEEGGSGRIEVYIGSAGDFGLYRKRACETDSSEGSKSWLKVNVMLLYLKPEWYTL